MKRTKPGPFADDEMLRELHRVRAAHYQKNKHLSPAQYVERVEAEAAAALQAIGFTTKRRRDGTEVVARTEKKRKVA